MEKNKKLLKSKTIIFDYFNRSQDKDHFIFVLMQNKKTFDFKSIDKDGDTMLMKIIENKIKISKDLLELSDVNYRKKEFCSALVLAIRREYPRK